MSNLVPVGGQFAATVVRARAFQQGNASGGPGYWDDEWMDSEVPA
jgi:hypothetical protein